MRSRSRLLLAILLGACSGGGDSTDPGTNAPPNDAVTEITLPSATMALSGPGAMGTVQATVRNAAGVIAAPVVSWTTSAPGIVTVSGTGATAQLTAVAAGSSTITATAGAKSANMTVTVNDPRRALTVTLSGAGVGRVTSSPAGIDCTAGSAIGCQALFTPTVAVTLTPVTSAGSAFDGWQGSCTGSGACVVTMDAAKAVQAAFRVLPAPVATIGITPSPISVTLGSTAQLTATLRDAAGTTLTGRTVTWTSSNDGIASVSATGVVTGRAAGGPVTITAASEGVSATVSATVQSPFVTATNISVGYRSTCAVELSGALSCWGENVWGQLGNGTALCCSFGVTPVASSQLFSQVDVAEYHACARTRASAMYCWGSGAALGDGTGLPRYVPTLVTGASMVTQVTTTSGTSCAIATDGLARCWGENNAGKLGVGSNAAEVLAPATVAGANTFRTLRLNGVGSTCGVTTANIAYCWGRNPFGVLGDSTGLTRTAPTRVRTDRLFADIATGDSHTCALDLSDAAWCWGQAEYGAIGNGQFAGFNEWYPVPQAVLTSARFKSIVSGNNHSCALTADGTAYCWGLNAAGQLGDGTTISRSAPVAVLSSTKFTQLSARGSSTCGIAASTIVYCWGANRQGQLGFPSSNASTTAPVAVPRP